MFAQLTNALKDVAADETVVKEFERLLLIAHLVTLKLQCEKAVRWLLLAGAPIVALTLHVSLRVCRRLQQRLPYHC